MGTDIHMFVERKIDGKWESINPPKPTVDKDAIRDLSKVEDLSRNWFYVKDEPKLAIEWNMYRHYDLFSILADVRNGHGVAGVKTSDGFVPIAERRGLPGDMSPILQKTFEDWLEHSPTWLTLDEIISFNWDLVVVKTGVVNKEEYKVFKETGAPTEWCGGVSGGNVEHISNSLMDIYLENGFPESSKDYYTSISWTKKYREIVGYFIDDIVPFIQKCCNVPPEDIRLVMHFDS